MATMALVLLIATPSGFMMSAKASGPMPLVICTGESHAALPDPAGKAPADRSHASACIYAGHGVALNSPPLLVQTPVERIAIVRTTARLSADRATLPLAAPPPPSQAPPAFI